MTEATRMDREFLKGARELASHSEVDHLLFISDVPIATETLRRRKVRNKSRLCSDQRRTGCELKAAG